MEQVERRKIVEDCLSRWQHGDHRTEYFAAIFDDWFKNIPENAIRMMDHLLSRFQYYPHKTVNSYLVELHKRLIQPGNITDDNTIYISIKTITGIGSSSNDYWVEYKLQNGINKYICIDDISKLNATQLAYISNIVIIDDCSGSGLTLTKYLSRNDGFFSGKVIYFITVHLMKDALDNIQKYAEGKNITINPIFMVNEDKAFSDEYFKDKVQLKELFIQMSKDLGVTEEKILGFKESEGLFAFYNNTPNNTLGLFWCNTEKNPSPFPRKNDKRPLWMTMSEQKEKREKQNYIAAMRKY